MINVDKLAKTMNNIIDKTKVPAQTLPAVLLFCTAMKRSGISAARTAANIISDNSELDIPSDENPDGTPNIINQYTYNIVRNVFKELKNNAQIQAVIPSGSLTIQSTGANAGGPVTTTGTNLLNLIIKGIIR